jgi:hypothetical protein
MTMIGSLIEVCRAQGDAEVASQQFRDDILANFSLNTKVEKNSRMWFERA